MVERKTAAARTQAAAAEVEKAPVGRFYELQQEVPPAEPYVLTEDIVIPPLTRAQLIALGKTETDEEFDQVMFGKHYDAISELYADRPIAEWRAFSTEFRVHYFGQGSETPGKSEESSDS